MFKIEIYSKDGETISLPEIKSFKESNKYMVFTNPEGVERYVNHDAIKDFDVMNIPELKTEKVVEVEQISNDEAEDILSTEARETTETSSDTDILKEKEEK